jgi:uncharacterized protein YoxC
MLIIQVIAVMLLTLALLVKMLSYTKSARKYKEHLEQMDRTTNHGLGKS